MKKAASNLEGRKEGTNYSDSDENGSSGVAFCV
jgi:hypothetical protein